MAKHATVEVVGAARLRATMLAAAAGLEDMEDATAPTARLIAQRSAGRAPKRTGRLATSLHATSTGDEARVSSSLVYAGVQHYGWAAHGITAHPFLVPTAEDSAPVWERFFVASVNRDLARVHGA